jgi:two-component system OmpR family sensor kinase
VLDRFYRMPGATATGSGLGLAIASAIAQLHGVTLELDRSPRLGGLRVGLRLPVL